MNTNLSFVQSNEELYSLVSDFNHLYDTNQVPKDIVDRIIANDLSKYVLNIIPLKLCIVGRSTPPIAACIQEAFSIIYAPIFSASEAYVIPKNNYTFEVLSMLPSELSAINKSEKIAILLIPNWTHCLIYKYY